MSESLFSLAARRRTRWMPVALSLAATLGAATGFAQSAAPSSAASAAPGRATPDDTILLTIQLKHDQSRPLSELNAQLAKQGFYKAFPPAGMEVVSWYVQMGIGQVVTLRLPASRVREVNRVLEDTAWGPYRTEFFLTYDYKAIAQQARERAQ